VKFEPGTLKAVSRRNGKVVLSKEIKTAGAPAKIHLIADRKLVKANGEDLCFVTVQITDSEGDLVPNADNLVKFELKGQGEIAGVDNGLQTSMEPFKASYRKAFNGKCLVIIKTTQKKGSIRLTAHSEGLKSSSIIIEAR
jgi:beta-galactosidase